MSIDNAANTPPLNASSSALSLSELEHHPEFWFGDGNIVLVAQRTGFRIYRGLLAAQSTVFADMFASTSSSADESETLERCPVVHLTDSSYDLAHLLRVLLPTSPTRCAFHPPKNGACFLNAKVFAVFSYRTADPAVVHSFDEVFAVVRLAHKYHIQSVQDEELRALQEYYLTSDFDVRFGPPKGVVSMKRSHYIGAANLARLTDTPLMLPFALYNCCYLSGNKLLEGRAGEDGTIEHLAPEDLQRCIDARTVLGRQEVFFVARLLEAVPQERCRDSARCAPVIVEIARRIMHEDPFPVFHALWEWSRLVEGFEGICKGCMEVVYERDKAERRRVWDALPETLGITVEGWAAPHGGEAAGDAA